MDLLMLVGDIQYKGGQGGKGGKRGAAGEGVS
jgi:hypothetical protein